MVRTCAGPSNLLFFGGSVFISKIVPYRISVVLLLLGVELMDAEATPNQIMASLQARLQEETEQRGNEELQLRVSINGLDMALVENEQRLEEEVQGRVRGEAILRAALVEDRERILEIQRNQRQMQIQLAQLQDAQARSLQDSGGDLEVGAQREQPVEKSTTEQRQRNHCLRCIVKILRADSAPFENSYRYWYYQFFASLFFSAIPLIGSMLCVAMERGVAPSSVSPKWQWLLYFAWFLTFVVFCMFFRGLVATRHDFVKAVSAAAREGIGPIGANCLRWPRPRS